MKVADVQERNARLGEEARAELEEQLKASGITTVDIDLWIDDDDLLVKKVEKGDTANGVVNSTVHYSDYGVDVSTEEPCGRPDRRLQGPDELPADELKTGDGRDRAALVSLPFPQGWGVRFQGDT